MAHGPRVALLKSRRLTHTIGRAHDGGSIHVVKQIEALREENCEFDVFTRNETEADEEAFQEVPGGRVWHIPFTRSKSSDLFIRDMEEGRSFVRGVLACSGFSASSFDAVLLHHWTSGVDIGDSLPKAMPLLFTPHLLASEKAAANRIDLPEPIARTERELLARADCTIALSTDEEQSCLRLGAKRVERVANGVSKAFFELPYGQRPEYASVIRLGTVGRLCTQKGTDILLDAVRKLVEVGLDVRLDIVGPPYWEEAFEAELKRRLLDGNLSGRVRILGPIPHEDLTTIFASWDIYIQPSLYESQCIALLEAMAAGRQVIATGLPAIREFLDTKSGTLLPAPPSAESIAGAVQQALVHPDWNDRVRNARAAARNYRWEHTTRQLMHHVRQTVIMSGWQHNQQDPRLTNQVEHQAQIVAQQIVRTHSVAGILLLGSGARGSAKPGSDVDLLVICDHLSEARQDWTPTTDQPIDIKWEPSSAICCLTDLTDELFAVTVSQRPIVDYLRDARPLVPLRPDISAAISLAVERRLSAPVQLKVADLVLAQAAAAFEEATIFVRKAARADAQLKLNNGAQLLLQGVMIRLGWTVRSAKRRLEGAVPYSRRSEQVRKAASFLTAAVGVDGVTYIQAQDLIMARMKLRKAHDEILHAFGKSKSHKIQNNSQPAVNSDYYLPAIAAGYLKGCVNHMRSLSGVPLMPSFYQKLFELDSAAPAQSFLDSQLVPAEIRQLWLKIMDPKDETTISFAAARGAALAAEFSGGKLDPTNPISTEI